MPVMNVLPKTTYNIVSTELTASKFIEFPVALNIPAGDVKIVTMIVRIHDYVGGNGSTVEVRLHNSAPSREDPAKVFRETADVKKVTVGYTSAVFPLLSTNFTAEGAVGEALDVIVKITQATVAVNLAITMSVDLAFKR